MIRKFIRQYPLDHLQQGAPLGNGALGALLWGGKQTLNMSLGRADLWDHRGGMFWTEQQNFKAIRSALERGDEEEIKRLFARKNIDPKILLPRPTLLPLGRVRFTLDSSCELLRNEILFDTGEVRVYYSTPEGEKFLSFCCDMECTHGFVCEGLTSSIQVELIPAGLLPGGKEALEARLFVPPETGSCPGQQAFLQKMPADPTHGILLRQTDESFVLEFARGKETIDEFFAMGTAPVQTIREKSEKWWNGFWKKIPSVTVPDADLEEVYTLGIYKYGIVTNPASGIIPGLQGPWIEDYRTPPWSGDYHFNINIQMYYTPGYKLGLFSHIRPLFDLVFSWKEMLRHNAECFSGIKDGYMLPHAVDDRGTCMGGFWAGCIDHACSAWIGMMMYDYCDHTGDMEFLRSEVFDFMKGVMRVFREMLEYKEDGTLTLPISISPEYRGSAMNAWGADSSFQLAAIHRLARNLIRSSELLGEKADPFWQEVEDKLPPYTLTDSFRSGRKEIALWEGTPLEESHRHHSHLGAITPFDTIDPRDEALKEILAFTDSRWTAMGMGRWSGWGVPWASQIRTRLGQPQTAVNLLKQWKYYFNDPGGASIHDAFYPGFSVFWSKDEVMQLDGGMGAVTAIGDLFVYGREGVLEFFRGIPENWKDVSFKGFSLPGGFKADGVYSEGKTAKITIQSSRKALLQLRTADTTELFTMEMEAGQSVTLTASGTKLSIV